MPARPAPPPPRAVLFAHQGEDWIRGAEQCLLDLLGGLDRARFRPVVACDAPALAREAAALGAPVLRVPRWGRAPVTAARTRRLVAGFMAEHRVALVHANMPDVLPVVAPAAYRRYVPVVAHLHVPYASVGERHRALVRRAAAAVGVAEHVVAPLRRELGPRGAGRVRVVPNGVHAERLAGGDARGLRAALGIPAAACVAAAVGSLIPRKGHDVTLRALAAARAAGVDAHLLLCGDGPAEPALRALARDLGVDGAAHFLGARPDVGAVLRDAADLVVSSAREEALPLNLLEAQWLGVPVLAARIAAHEEALGPGAGVLVPGEDPAALAGALAALAADPARRRALGDAGRAWARARYAMPRYLAAFEALYAELLARPGAEFGGPLGSDWPRAFGSWLRIGVQRRLGRRARP